MIPYFIVLGIPAIMALFFRGRVSQIAWVTTFIIYLLFIGTRFEIGPDWSGYEIIHWQLEDTGLKKIIFSAEPLSNLIFWFTTHFGGGLFLSNMIAAYIILCGVFQYSRGTSNPWIAIVAATPYLLFIISMSGIRQAMAIGVILSLLAKWPKYSLMGRTKRIIIAALFHTSALVNSILLVTQLNIRKINKIVLTIIILGATYYTATEIPVFADSMLQYRYRYLEDPTKSDSVGAIFHVGLILIPSIIGFIFWKRIRKTVHNKTLIRIGIYGGFALLAMSFIPIISSTLPSRLSIYLYFLPMTIYPALIQIFGRRNQTLTTLCIITMHFAILLVWMIAANHSYAYIPYQSWLFP